MSPRVSVKSDPNAVLALQSVRYSQSLERGLVLLERFNGERPELGIADMSDLTGIIRSTTHRYATTLVALGYLEQTGTGRKYRLGLRASDLGMAALDCIELRHLAHPYLVELRNRVSYTVSIAMLDRGEAVLLDRLRGYRGATRLNLDLGPGSRLPLYCTSVGKVLLAHLPEQESKAIVESLVLARQQPRGITQKRVLSRELLGVRDAGFALSKEELKRGDLSMAVPVRDGTGAVVAAMGITVPVAKVSQERLVGELGPYLTAAAERVSTVLASAGNEPEAAGGRSAL